MSSGQHPSSLGAPLLPGTRRPPIEGRLEVIDEPGCAWVVVDGDSADWLVCFDKSGGFPAGAWAENMANVYNRRTGEAT